MNLTLKVWRQQDTKSAGKFVSYQVQGVTPDMSFLEMLDLLVIFKLSDDLLMLDEALKRPWRSIVTRNQADTKIGNHNAPIFIAAMSFGSQGETTFRAYAEAAKRLKIVAMNGEGGEIPDMMGKYKEFRGQQVLLLKRIIGLSDNELPLNDTWLRR